MGGPPAWATKVVKPDAVPAISASGVSGASSRGGACRPRRNQCSVKPSVMQAISPCGDATVSDGAGP